jgi:hypothetical protein
MFLFVKKNSYLTPKPAKPAAEEAANLGSVRDLAPGTFFARLLIYAYVFICYSRKYTQRPVREMLSKKFDFSIGPAKNH